jgi:hypothetical protein
MASYAYTFASGDTVTPTKLNNARTVSEIVNADVSATAAIAGSKVAPNFGGQNIATTGSVSAGAGSVISGATTTAALRVTQTGSGNAIEIEDSTNPDATPFVINQSGQTVIGHTSTFSTRLGGATVIPALQQLASANSGSSTVKARFSADTAPAASYFAKSRSPSIGEHAAVSAGDQLGNISFGGSDGSKIVEAARITGAADAAANTDDLAGRIVFSTTPSGSDAVAERMRITNAGRVGIATTNPSTELHVAGTITATAYADITSTSGLIASVSDGSSIVRSSRASTDASGPQIDFRKSRGTQAAQTMVADGDTVGEVRFVAYDGAADREAARIRATVDGTPASADMPARLQFYTTADGAGSVTERMRITNAGIVAIGTTSPNAVAQLDVTSTTRGFLPPRMTSAQRDAIATPPAGLMVYNSTTNKLNFYNGTAWEAVTSA